VSNYRSKTATHPAPNTPPGLHKLNVILSPIIASVKAVYITAAVNLQQAACNKQENPITTAIQLATNCYQNSATVADLWQVHQHFYVPVQKYSN
jgi:hypothetical protein